MLIYCVIFASCQLKCNEVGVQLASEECSTNLLSLSCRAL